MTMRAMCARGGAGDGDAGSSGGRYGRPEISGRKKKTEASIKDIMERDDPTHHGRATLARRVCVTAETNRRHQTDVEDIDAARRGLEALAPRSEKPVEVGVRGIRLARRLTDHDIETHQRIRRRAAVADVEKGDEVVDAQEVASSPAKAALES